MTATTATSIYLIVTLILIGLLAQKELLGGLPDQRIQRISRGLSVMIGPLLVVFLITLITRIALALR